MNKDCKLDYDDLREIANVVILLKTPEMIESATCEANWWNDQNEDIDETNFSIKVRKVCRTVNSKMGAKGDKRHKYFGFCSAYLSALWELFGSHESALLGWKYVNTYGYCRGSWRVPIGSNFEYQLMYMTYERLHNLETAMDIFRSNLIKGILPTYDGILGCKHTLMFDKYFCVNGFADDESEVAE